MVNTNHVCLHKGYISAINSPASDSQHNTTCIRGGAENESILLYLLESLCFLPVLNTPAEQPREKEPLLPSRWRTPSRRRWRSTGGRGRRRSQLSSARQRGPSAAAPALFWGGSGCTSPAAASSPPQNTSPQFCVFSANGHRPMKKKNNIPTLPSQNSSTIQETGGGKKSS